MAFSSITEAAAQVAGGHLDTYTGTPEMIPLVKGGQLRMVASVSVDRWPEFPEVPTLRERGFDTVTRQLIGFAGPAGLPVAVRDKLATALLAAAHDRAVQERQTGASVAPRPMTREDCPARNGRRQRHSPTSPAGLSPTSLARRT